MVGVRDRRRSLREESPRGFVEVRREEREKKFVQEKKRKKKRGIINQGERNSGGGRFALLRPSSPPFFPFGRADDGRAERER